MTPIIQSNCTTESSVLIRAHETRLICSVCTCIYTSISQCHKIEGLHFTEWKEFHSNITDNNCRPKVYPDTDNIPCLLNCDSFQLSFPVVILGKLVMNRETLKRS